MTMTYLTAARRASLYQYLTDCRNGMEQLAAWKAHKARMGEL
jgi:hypothetical protein